MRIAVVGASSTATVQFAAALAHWTDEQDTRGTVQLRLFGRDGYRLGVVTNVVTRILHERAAVMATTHLETSLHDADLVMVQARVGGLPARQFDETFPQLADLPGEETLGPGGLANALRTVRELAPTFEAIARCAPSALVLVLTNPAGIVRQAAASYGLRAIEVCEAPHVLLGLVADVLDCPVEELLDRYVGMNHVGFYVPHDGDELARLHGLVPIAGEEIERLGVLPLGYLRYYLDPGAAWRSQLGRPTRAEQLMVIEHEARVLLSAVEVPDPQARPSPWYALAVLPIIDGIVRSSGATVLAGCANDARVATLPNAATVEGPAVVERSGRIATRNLPLLPAPALELLEAHAHYEERALEACRRPTRSSVRSALEANPMTKGSSKVDALVDAIANSPFGVRLS